MQEQQRGYFDNRVTILTFADFSLLKRENLLIVMCYFVFVLDQYKWVAGCSDKASNLTTTTLSSGKIFPCFMTFDRLNCYFFHIKKIIAWV